MLVSHNKKIILASTSKIRRQILKDVGLSFEVIAPTYDEDKEKKNLNLEPKNLALFLAKQKALSISKLFPDAYVIGSDQVCEFEEKEVSKSKSLSQAMSQLKKFNGKNHLQNNAVVVALNGKIVFSKFSKVNLKMRKMKSSEIENYVNKDQPIGCAGSYKYESLGKHLFERVSGDYYSVLGLAIQPLLNFLHKKEIISID